MGLAKKSLDELEETYEDYISNNYKSSFRTEQYIKPSKSRKKKYKYKRDASKDSIYCWTDSKSEFQVKSGDEMTDRDWSEFEKG